MIEYEGTAYLLQLKESCNEQERVWLDEVANEIWERRKKREK